MPHDPLIAVIAPASGNEGTRMSYTLGSLFSGIGGIDLGFERAGFTTAWQVEIEPYAQKVLAKRFPHAERFSDIRDCGSGNLERVDVIAGGFPCQDISNAGLRAGITGERSGLWREMHRIISELRPRFVFVENVAALLGRGMGRVLGDLSEVGYDAEWQVVSAADVGAPHLRERIWILAYPMHSGGCAEYGQQQEEWPAIIDPSSAGDVAYSSRERRGEAGRVRLLESTKWIARSSEEVDDTEHVGIQIRRRAEVTGRGNLNPSGIYSDEFTSRAEQAEPILANTVSERGRSRDNSRQDAIHADARSETIGTGSNADWWAVEPSVGRVAHGIPKRVDRLRGLGNAVVPQIPEMFAREIRRALERAA